MYFQYVFSALEDCVVHINRVKHLDSPQLLLESYKNEIFMCLKQRLLDKICKGMVGILLVAPFFPRLSSLEFCFH